jgi:Glu-tRNA(Gln) amidotransferase subunit E-like FAD-binding protein
MGLDYKKLDFKCGIEIHQQLEGKKLFCDCPTDIRRDKPDFEVVRRLRAIAGEVGGVDIAALHEQMKRKYFVYQGYNETTCLVELDEEPPHEVNKEALRITLQIAVMLNAKIVDTVRFMRKTVIDGSNTSGFQRTALVGMNGYIMVDGKKIGIPTICLEEESCQVIERKPDHDVYNLSRLGIPLIEIATDPDIENAEECKKAALKLGMILRSVDGLKRGIGSIRQDVNISIKGGARTEIKGFQEVKSIPVVIEHEVKRQLSLTKSGKKVEPGVRKAEPDGTTSFLRPMPGAARMYPETDVMPVRVEIKGIKKVELIEEKAEKIHKLGLGKDLADAVSKAGKADIVIGFVKKFGKVKPAFIAETMISTPKTIRRKENVEVYPTDEEYEKIFEHLNKGTISKDSIYDILVELGKTKKLDFSKHKLMSDAELEKEIKKIIKEFEKLPLNAVIGRAMGKLKGKAEGRKIVEMIKKFKK